MLALTFIQILAEPIQNSTLNELSGFFVEAL